MNAIKFTLKIPWTCCNGGDMQTSEDRVLLLVLVKIGSLSSPVYTGGAKNCINILRDVIYVLHFEVELNYARNM
jgi:hypothetical protein